VILAILLFPPTTAAVGILVLALADPAAGFLGRRWGRVRLGAGTVEGSAAFLVVSFLVVLPFAPAWVSLVVALATAVVEAIPWPADDNLTVPLTAAGAFLLLTT
jgi:dolichol kinase